MGVDFGASAGSCLYGLCYLSSGLLLECSDGFFMAAVTAGISLLSHLHLSNQAINWYTKAKAQKATGWLNPVRSIFRRMLHWSSQPFEEDVGSFLHLHRRKMLLRCIAANGWRWRSFDYPRGCWLRCGGLRAERLKTGRLQQRQRDRREKWTHTKALSQIRRGFIALNWNSARLSPTLASS